MGSLIVLLVVVVQQAKSQGAKAEIAAVEPSPDPVPPEPEFIATVEEPAPAEIAILRSPVPPFAAPPIEADPSIVLEDAVADVQWANEQLAASREATRQDLAESRMELSRLEDQTRRLSEQLDLMEKQAADLLAAEEGKARPNQLAQSQIEDIKKKIDVAKAELAKKQEAAKAVSDQQYALVAYDGQNGTRRRPIYIECTAAGVKLQPEGIQITVDDLLVTGPTNALSAALRITREYLSDAGVTQISGEPYPLIVVRPGGETAFVASRRSLKGWDEDWGYELVPHGMELAFPESDSSLATLLNNTISQIREATAPQIAAIKRARMLAQQGRGNTSQGYSIGQAAGSGLIPRGGGGRAGRPGGPGQFSRNAPGSGPGNGLGNNSANGLGSGFGNGALTAPQSGMALAGATGGQSPIGSNAPLGQNGNGTSNIPGTLSSGTPGQAGITQVAGSASTRAGDQFESLIPGASSQGSGATNGGSSQNGSPSVHGAAANGTSTANGSPNNGSAASNGAAGSGGSPGNGQTAQSQGVNNSRGSQFQTGGTGGSGGPQFGSSGSAQSSQGSTGSNSSLSLTPAQGTNSDSAPHANSIAASQGSNWALPGANGGGIGITRPLQVYCGREYITILGESGTTNSRHDNLAINGDLQAAMKPLAETIWQRIEHWGIAGPNVYWKPVLQFRVEPGAEQQYEQIKILLDGSGFEVQRAQ